MDDFQPDSQAWEALNYTPIGVVILREDFSVVHWNMCLEEWTGINSTEMLGTSVVARFPAFARPDVADRIQTVFAGGPPVLFSSQLHHCLIPRRDKKTSFQDVMVTGVPAADGDGFFAMFAIQDVTDLTTRVRDYWELNKRLERTATEREAEIDERKKAEEALRKSEQELSDFFDNATVGLHWEGPDGTILRANHAELDLLGYSRDEYVGRHIAEFHVDQNEIEDILSKLSEGENIRNRHAQMRCKDGSIKHVLIDSSVLWENGEFIHTRCFTRDITDRRRAEEELQFKDHAIYSSITGFAFGTLDGEISYANPAFVKMFGYEDESEVVGRLNKDFASDASIIDEIMTSVKAQGFWQGEDSAKKKDGTSFPIELEVSLMKDASGEPLGIVATFIDISERKQAEANLKESESRLRQMAEQSRDVVWLQETGTGKTIYCTPAYETIWGRSLAGLYESPGDWVESILPDDRQRVLDAYDRLLDNEPFEQEYRIARPDGSVRWILDRGIPITDEQGRVYRVAGSAVDITERKESELALRDREERLATILNGAVDSIVTIDRDGNIVNVNATTERIFGYTEEELVGQDARMLTPVPDRRELEHPEPGEARNIGVEVMGRRKDGSLFPVDLAVSEVQHLGLFIGIIRDVSEQKKAEEALRHEHELSESIIDTTQNIVLFLDKDGRIVRFNSYMEQLTGWRLDEVRGRDAWDTFVPEHDRPHIRNLFKRALQGERIRGKVSVLVTKQGHEREIEWCDAPLTDAGGQLVGLLCTGLDITERRMLEREILEIVAEEERRIGQELHDSTQQQLTGLGLIAQNVAEVLQQINQANNESRQLREAGLSDRVDELQRRAMQVHSGLKHAAHEVNQLARGLIPVELDAEGLRSSLTELARSMNETQNVDCIFECDDPVKVASNFTATYLYRIAQEAVNNALKHSGADRIEISLSDHDEAITLKIHDNGNGAVKKHADGPGMGLRIMAYRAELIGAELNIRPAKTGGTEVVCTISQ